MIIFDMIFLDFFVSFCIDTLPIVLEVFIDAISPSSSDNGIV